MNLIETIKSYLGGDILSKLASLIGEDETKTRSAVGAAVPSLLSALAGQASTSDGAQRLASSLGGFDTGILGNLGGMLSGQSGSMLDKGSSMLGSLLGGGTVSSIVSAICRFTGLGAGAIQKLLGFLMPVVMGTIAKQFMGKSISPQGLSGFFSDQAANISNALPSGLSLAGIPGVGSVSTAARHGVGTAKGAGTSVGRWLIPLLGLGLLGLLAWQFLGRSSRTTVPTTVVTPPATTAWPQATQLAKDLTATYTDATTALSGITDVESARTALPKLTDLNTKLDNLRGVWDTIPDAGRSSVRSVTTSLLSKLRDLATRVLGISGVGDIIKPIVDQILAKLSAFGA